MHELGIVFYVIEEVEKVATKNHVNKVNSLTLEVGEVSSVVPEYFVDAYNWAIKKTKYMQDCKLNLVILEGISYCKDCKKTFKTTTNGKICPHCHSENTYLVSGSEINIKDIQVE